MSKTEIRVETLDYGPEVLLQKRGLRDQMIKVLMGLDVLVDRSPSMDDDFWGLLRSEIGRAGLSCDDLPRSSVQRGTGATGSVIVLHGDSLRKVLECVGAAIDLWMMHGHSRERMIELEFVVGRDRGMERAEIRGPAQSTRDALKIGMDGFSEIGRTH